MNADDKMVGWLVGLDFGREGSSQFKGGQVEHAYIISLNQILSSSLMLEDDNSFPCPLCKVRCIEMIYTHSRSPSNLREKKEKYI